MKVEVLSIQSFILIAYHLLLPPSLPPSLPRSQCDRLASIRSLISQLMERETQVRYMIVGPGCSTGALITAETAPFYSLTQVSSTLLSIELLWTTLSAV